MKRLIITLFTLGLVWALPAQQYISGEASGQVATVTLLKGQLSVRDGLGKELASPKVNEDVAVARNNQIMVEENSQAQVNFPDGSIIKLNPSTDITLLKSGILIRKGELWLNINKETNFQVITSDIVCLARGAEFLIQADQQNSVTHLISGQLKVGDKIGKTIVLEPGQALKATDVGFGSVVGFDEQERMNAFNGTGGAAKGQFRLNTLVIAGGVLAVFLLLIVLWFFRRKKSRRTVPARVKPAPAPVIPERERTTFQQPVAERKPEVQGPQAKPKFCGECGAPVVEDAKFCISCGARME